MYCSKCGESIPPGVRFCPSCGCDTGAGQQPAPQPQQPYQPQPPQQPYQQPPGQPTFQQPPPMQPPYAQPPQPKIKPPHYAPGTFIERIHSFGGDMLFMIGIILFTAGALIDLFIGFENFHFLNLLILAVPVTAMWLVFVASKIPKLPEKVLPALTLFKVAIIIAMVMAGIMAIAFLLLFIALITEATIYAIVFLVALGGIVVFFIMFFIPLLNMVQALKAGILTGQTQGIQNLKTLTIFTYIWVGAFGLLSLLGLVAPNTIIDFVAGVADGLVSAYMGGSEWMINLLYTEGSMWAMEPTFIHNVFNWVLGIGDSWALRVAGGGDIAGLFRLVQYAGIVICFLVINKFNDSLFGRAQG